MVSKYPQVLDEERLESAKALLCEVFGVPGLRAHQELAGKNILRGKTTVYDIPTGGGKTLGFWYPLFYYWDSKEAILTSQRVALVVSPLNALMNSQAKALEERGIPALAVNNEGGSLNDIFEVCKQPDSEDRIKHRVIFVSPEMALSTPFHEKVLKNKVFRTNCLELVIDEAHCASEWGEDFRPEYAELGKLLSRLPSGVPVLLASATMPEDVISDVIFKVGVSSGCERVAVSNAKHNVALSVRILQHLTSTYADLYSLFPAEGGEFLQTLIYVNSRMEAEEIQDFFRRHCPSHIPPESFEFYHRNLTAKQKQDIQDGLRSGRLRCVIATDALGMGMDFPCIQRVILWHEPLSFLSLIQKIGRAVRQLHEYGEAIIFVTKAAYRKHLIALEAGRDGGETEGEGDNILVGAEGEPVDRIAAIDTEESDEDDTPTQPIQRGQRKKAQSALEARDQKFLSQFIATSDCRRAPWDDFFNNTSKLPFFVCPVGACCCDNCEPDKFLVHTIKVTYPYPTRAPRSTKPSEELSAAVTVALRNWRNWRSNLMKFKYYLVDQRVCQEISIGKKKSHLLEIIVSHLEFVQDSHIDFDCTVNTRFILMHSRNRILLSNM
ncbi:P-loop containing nucleoside triphosphate hydrolase protein [Rhodocollybia butyracea]|uniref:DNA 3'-5' helicase n=1 Tax=Rhodocollybia butyracea TaxID=206335 RepID=A0A9P5P3I9_9AGAR|nr:P-loop containing nucleoside triphosphate hydrolase protein [Rhodocollybia butyracea]